MMSNPDALLAGLRASLLRQGRNVASPSSILLGLPTSNTTGMEMRTNPSSIGFSHPALLSSVRAAAALHLTVTSTAAVSSQVVLYQRLRLEQQLRQQEELSRLYRYVLQQEQQEKLRANPCAQILAEAGQKQLKQQQGEERVSQGPQPSPLSDATPRGPRRSPKETLVHLGKTLRSPTDVYEDVSQIVLVDPPPPNDSTDKTKQLEVSSPTAATTRNKNRSVGGGQTHSFAKKLHDMLSNPKTDHIVSFLPHGRAFMVHNVEEFRTEVMPKVFRHDRWTSFARQLSLYGFRRIQRGPDAGAFYHELFLRGRPELADYMRRVGLPKGSEDRRKLRGLLRNRPDPDFARMPVVRVPSSSSLRQEEWRMVVG